MSLCLLDALPKCTSPPALVLGIVLPATLTLLLSLSVGTAAAQEPAAEGAAAQKGPTDVVMVVHGGAGGIERGELSPEREKRYRAKLREAIMAGYEALQEGRSSLDAVEETITLLESSRLFNAGRGAVFTNQGTVEHDASIMEGETHNAGAVAGVKHIRHPIQAARLVMTESRHVMLAREGAEAFAEEHGMESVPNDYFYTEERRRRFLERHGAGPKDSDDDGGPRFPEWKPREEPARDAKPPPLGRYGTVGAVALGPDGTLAAGTSTGGLSNKQWGRIGDSPIVGAGVYADNATCGVSSTGTGEYFIRGVIPHDIASMMRYTDASVQEAAYEVIMEKLPEIGDGEGTGGVIALDAEGNAAMPFNTPGMFRGYVTEEGEVTIYFYGDEGYGSEERRGE